MSLIYVLALATQARLDDVADRLRDLLGARPGAGHDFDVPAMDVKVYSMDDFSRQVIKESWDIESTTKVAFHVHNNAPVEEYMAARRNMSVGSVDLAVQFGGEAVWHFQGDRAMMRRKDGFLYLHDWWPEWADPEVARRIPWPFEVVHEGGFPAPE
jgi:hypothetical protein